jgi:hypothetical protein
MVKWNRMGGECGAYLDSDTQSVCGGTLVCHIVVPGGSEFLLEIVFKH